MYLTNEGTALKEQYGWEARSQWRGEPLEGDIEAQIRIFHGDKRKRDVDNYNKLILDALSGIIYYDDKQITKISIEKLYDKEHPRIELTFTKI